VSALTVTLTMAIAVRISVPTVCVISYGNESAPKAAFGV